MFNKIFIVPPTYGSEHVFGQQGFEIMDTDDKAEAIVFSGGADIDPSLYGQKKLPTTHNIPERDRRELLLYIANQGKPMLGICRGGQFLNALNGGTMWQHVNNHSLGPHKIYMYNVKGELVGDGMVNSVHHQQMRMGEGGLLLGVSHVSDKREDDTKVEHCSVQETFEDPEIIWYPRTKAFCFQPHPEFGHPETTKIFFEYVRSLYS